MKQYLLFAWNNNDKRHGWENFIKDFEAEEQEEALKTAKQFDCYQIINSRIWKIDTEFTYINHLRSEVDKLQVDHRVLLEKYSAKLQELQNLCQHKEYTETSNDFADFSSSETRTCNFCGLRETDRFIKIKG